MERVPIRLTRKAIRRTPVGGVLMVTPNEAKTLKALKLGEDAEPSGEPPAKRPRGRPRKETVTRELAAPEAPTRARELAEPTERGRYRRMDLRPEE